MVKKNIQVKQRIVSIDLISFQVSVLEPKVVEKIDKTKMIFEFNINAEVQEKTKTITIDLHTTFFASEDKSLQVGNMTSKATFEVLNISEIIKEYKDLPAEIMATFIGVLISTSRGFHILKSQGTFLEGSVIPIVLMDQIIRTDKE